MNTGYFFGYSIFIALMFFCLPIGAGLVRRTRKHRGTGMMWLVFATLCAIGAGTCAILMF